MYSHREEARSAAVLCNVFLHLSFFRVSTFGGTSLPVFWNAVGRRVMPGFVLIEKSF